MFYKNLKMFKKTVFPSSCFSVIFRSSNCSLSTPLLCRSVLGLGHIISSLVLYCSSAQYRYLVYQLGTMLARSPTQRLRTSAFKACLDSGPLIFSFIMEVNNQNQVSSITQTMDIRFRAGFITAPCHCTGGRVNYIFLRKK